MPFGAQYNYMTLSVGGRTLTAEMPLTAWAPEVPSGALSGGYVISLFTGGPEIFTIPLYVAPQTLAFDDNAPLYMEAPWATGSSPGTEINYATSLAVSGTVYYAVDGSTPLFLSCSPVASGVGNMGLRASGAAGISTSNISFVTSGALPGSLSDTMTLFLPIEDTATSGIPLYLERPLDAMIPLYIKYQMASGVVPVAISGAYMPNSSATLFTRSPTTTSLTTFTSGFNDS
tara:strand:+ start:507 stop:1199 length:693 start_codon:yes stop_codon:yes gene_type:complete